MRFIVAILLAAAVQIGAARGDWLQFRGTNSNSAAAGPKIDWKSKESIAWKAPLPGRGPSSPIVVDGRVIVTASSGPRQERLHVLALDAASGKQLWHRQFWATGRTQTHPTSAVAANTPTSDGKLIFAFYSSNDLICLDLEGNLRWYRGLAHDWPKAGNDAGMSSSPVVIGDTVIVQVENQGDSFAAGIDKATGQTRWRIEREPRASWSSPVELKGKTPADSVVLLQSPSGLSAHDPATGVRLWEFKDTCAGITSSTPLAGGRVCLPAGGLTLLEAQPSGRPKTIWQQRPLFPGPSSPVVHDGRVYVVSRVGVVTCAELESGESQWRLRTKGPYWSTPVLVGRDLVLINHNGLLQVVKVGEKGKLADKVELGESVLATPAVAEGGVFVRTEKHLIKFAPGK